MTDGEARGERGGGERGAWHAPVAGRYEMRGESGLARMSIDIEWDADDRHAFRADAYVVVAGDVSLTTFDVSPHRIRRDASHIEDSPCAGVTVAVVRSGTVSGSQDGRRWHLEAGEAVVLRNDRPFEAESPSGSSVTLTHVEDFSFDADGLDRVRAAAGRIGSSSRSGVLGGLVLAELADLETPLRADGAALEAVVIAAVEAIAG
jgi:hypothetical protein